MVTEPHFKDILSTRGLFVPEVAFFFSLSMANVLHLEQFNRLRREFSDFFGENGVLNAIIAALTSLTGNNQHLLNSYLNLQTRIANLERNVNISIQRLNNVEESLRRIQEQQRFLRSNLAGNLISIYERLDQLSEEGSSSSTGL